MSNTKQNALNRCLNCQCHENESIAAKLSRRIQRLITTSEFRHAVTFPRNDIKERTSRDPVWGFGFDGFIPNTETDNLVGRLRAAIADRNPLYEPVQWRFYAITLLQPHLAEFAKPYEHVRACRHEIPTGTPYGDCDDLLVMTDTQMIVWLAVHWNKLARYVEAREDIVVGA